MMQPVRKSARLAKKSNPSSSLHHQTNSLKTTSSSHAPITDDPYTSSSFYSSATSSSSSYSPTSPSSLSSSEPPSRPLAFSFTSPLPSSLVPIESIYSVLVDGAMKKVTPSSVVASSSPSPSSVIASTATASSLSHYSPLSFPSPINTRKRFASNELDEFSSPGFEMHQPAASRASEDDPNQSHLSSSTSFYSPSPYYPSSSLHCNPFPLFTLVHPTLGSYQLVSSPSNLTSEMSMHHKNMYNGMYNGMLTPAQTSTPFPHLPCQNMSCHVSHPSLHNQSLVATQKSASHHSSSSLSPNPPSHVPSSTTATASASHVPPSTFRFVTSASAPAPSSAAVTLAVSRHAGQDERMFKAHRLHVADRHEHLVASPHPSREQYSDQFSEIILSLPLEIIVYFASYLDHRELCRLGLCSRKLFSVCESDALWQTLFKKQYPLISIQSSTLRPCSTVLSRAVTTLEEFPNRPKSWKRRFFELATVQVFGCGYNSHGSLGLGDIRSRNKLEIVPNLATSRVISVASTTQQTFAISVNGDLFHAGQDQATIFSRVPLPGPCLGVSSGLSHVIVIARSPKSTPGSTTDSDEPTENLVIGWGANGLGQLGTGSAANRAHSMTIIRSLTAERIVSVACGSDHSLAMSKSGKVFAWGWNSDGQLGLGDEVNRFQPTLIPDLDVQRGEAVSDRLNADSLIVGIACGLRNSVAWSAKGSVYSWGRNNLGQLGLGDTVQRLKPTKLSELPQGSITTDFEREELGHSADDALKTLQNGVVQVSCGDNHTLALCQNGLVYSWGCNGDGQLGLGHQSVRSGPTEVVFLPRASIVRVSCGASHSQALCRTGVLYNWGQNIYGQLAQDNKQRAHCAVPQPVRMKGKEVIGMAGPAGDHLFVLAVDA